MSKRFEDRWNRASSDLRQLSYIEFRAEARRVRLRGGRLSGLSRKASRALIELHTQQWEQAYELPLAPVPWKLFGMLAAIPVAGCLIVVVAGRLPHIVDSLTELTSIYP